MTAYTPELPPQAGDLVRIIDECSTFFTAGAIARLDSCDKDGDWWASFDGLGNGPESFATMGGNSTWAIGKPGAAFEPLEAQPGDVVRVADGQPPYFEAGTRARLLLRDAPELWLADFRELGNADGTFQDKGHHGDGRWYLAGVGCDCFVVERANAA